MMKIIQLWFILILNSLMFGVSIGIPRRNIAGTQNKIVSAGSPLLLPYEQWKGNKVLFVFAHIDDMELTSGGLVYLLNEIADVHLLILTNGDKGCSNPEICTNKTNSDVADIRRVEQANSASILGIQSQNIHFLPYEDCQLNQYPKGDVQKDIVRILREVQPEVVFSWDLQPRFQLLASNGWGDLGYHPDHQLSGQFALDSVWQAELDRLWPELGPSWRVREFYFTTFIQDQTPLYYVDITGDAYKKKLEAFAQMKSQYTDFQELERWVAFVSSNVGELVGQSADRPAEAFSFVLW